MDGSTPPDAAGAPAMSARELVMALFDSARDPVLSAAYLGAAAALFDIDGPALRVALLRLVRRGVLRRQGRGRYALGASGTALHARVRHWQQVEADVVVWKGAWLAVHGAYLPGAARQEQQARALRLRGFAAAADGLWWRPANLRFALQALHAELTGLGLAEAARLLQVAQLHPNDLVPGKLWDIDALHLRYHVRLEQLQASETRIRALPVAAAARASLQLGRVVTREILMDPLLPAELVDVEARRRLLAAMVAYNRFARACWARFAADFA